jgi:hypothetical protein
VDQQVDEPLVKTGIQYLLLCQTTTWDSSPRWAFRKASSVNQSSVQTWVESVGSSRNVVRVRDRWVSHLGDRRDCFPFICGTSWRSWVSKVGNIEWKGNGGGFENFARRFADIARTLSSKTSTRPGNYQWWPVRPRGGLRQDSCTHFVYIALFFFRGLFACYWGARPPSMPWGRCG